MTKVGRPRTDKPYRKNLVRIGAVEDMLLELLEKVPPRSQAKDIIKNELANLRLRELKKTLDRVAKTK